MYIHASHISFLILTLNCQESSNEEISVQTDFCTDLSGWADFVSLHPKFGLSERLRIDTSQHTHNFTLM